MQTIQPIYFDGIVLSAFADSDAESFATAARESAETVGRWMPWCHEAFTTHDALSWFDISRAGLAAGTALEFGIFDESTSAFLGGAGLNSINQQHLFCNLGYWVRQSEQRRGIASRCVRALASHAFNELHLQRVEIVVALGNTASEGVATKAGAQFECIARNRLHIRGVSVPASIFSLVPGLPIQQLR